MKALSQIYIKGKSKTHPRRIFWQHVLITFQTNQKFITSIFILHIINGLFIYLAVYISAVSKQITMAVDQSTKIQSKNRIHPRTSFQMQLKKTLLFSMQGRPSVIDSPAPAHLLMMPAVSTTIICYAAFSLNETPTSND
jgi:hypothetical protein